MKGMNQRVYEYGKKMIHRKIWEEHFGKIPVGYVIHHKNGDKKDNRIENLQCLTIKEHGFIHRKKGRLRIVYPSGNIAVIRLKE